MNELIEGLEAAGLRPIVIDEDFDFARMPLLRETNVEFVRRVMEVGCPTGAMIQPFVIEALTRYADEVLASGEAWNNGLIDHTVWRETAAFLKAELDKKYRL